MATMMSGTTDSVEEYKPWWDGLFSNSSSIGGTIGGTGAVVAGIGAVVGGLMQNWTQAQKREYIVNRLAELAKNGDKKAQQLYEYITGNQAVDIPKWIEGATGKRGVLENIWTETNIGTGTQTGELAPHTGTLEGQQTTVPETGTLDVRPEILNPQAGTIDLSQWTIGATGKRGIAENVSTGNNTATQVLDIPGLANLGKGIQSDTVAKPIETPAHVVPTSQKMKRLLEAKNALDIGLQTGTGTGTGTATGTGTGDLFIPGLSELGKGLRNGQDVISKPIETPAHVVPSAKNLQLLLQREGIELGGLPDPDPLPKPIEIPVDNPIPGTETGTQTIPIPGTETGTQAIPIPGTETGTQAIPIPGTETGTQAIPIPGTETGTQAIPIPGTNNPYFDLWGNNEDDEVNENTQGEYNMADIDWLKWLEENQAKQWQREDDIRRETQAREDSAYQRAVKDMYKAGINPNLMNVQPASAGGGITNATGINTGILEAQISSDTKLLEQMLEQAFKGDENSKDRFTGILGNLIQSIVTAMIFKG